jgi:hypothetical protein
MGWAPASRKVTEMFLLLVFTGLEYVQAMLVYIRETRFDFGAPLRPTSRPAEWQTISELVIALNRLQSVIMH